MINGRGLFVTIDGPMGIGKSTVCGILARKLEDLDFSVLPTKEPTSSPLGQLARHHTDEYQGLVLACLVAADRYHHLQHVIRPAVAAGMIVVCDRYVASSYVLQRMDGVDAMYLRHLNSSADIPDLMFIMTGDAEGSHVRVQERTTRLDRFHRGGTDAALQEELLYRQLAQSLKEEGYPVIHHDVLGESAQTVASEFLPAILDRVRNRDLLT
jgi:dTMP kinase